LATRNTQTGCSGAASIEEESAALAATQNTQTGSAAGSASIEEETAALAAAQNTRSGSSSFVQSFV
jgi:hypothetical protein